MQIEFDLGNPNFTLLHRAGLAGLWMTLKQLEKEKVAPPEGWTLQLTERHVRLSWEDHDQTMLEWLLRESFQIRDGLISLRGLDSKTMRKDALASVHQGILGTFLQHTSTHKSTEVKRESLPVEGEPEITITYKALESYVYQDFASNLCDQQGRLLKKPIRIAGWLNPGAVVRHIAFSTDTSFEESPENVLVLLFAPVACYYYILRSKLRDKRALYALVIPEVIDLQKFARYKQDMHQRYATYKDFYASGLGDAGLRFLTYETTAEIASSFGVPRCQIVTLGTVAWATQQKTRTDLYVVEADSEVCHNYRICRDELSDRIILGKNGGFVSTSFARELIAENLARGKSWYSGIADKINNNELFEKLSYERGSLYQVIQKVEWDDCERLFVQACHQALSFIYGQLNEQVKRKGGSPGMQKELRNSLIKRETVRIRSGLGRCRSSESFREFIVNFFARAGRVPTLKSHWTELMQLVMGDGDWKRARDLALLALASYKGKRVTDSDQKQDVSDEEQEAIELP